MAWSRALICVVAGAASLLSTSCPAERGLDSVAQLAAPAPAAPVAGQREAARVPPEAPTNQAKRAAAVADDPPIEEPAAAELTEQPAADGLDDTESSTELVALPAAPADQEPEVVGDADAVIAHPYQPDFGVDPERALTATRKETYVFEKPSWRSTKLGYLRAGAVVKRSADAVRSGKDCRGGWYQVEPQGYVCAGNTASLDIQDPEAVAARQLPDRSDGLPYAYGISRYPTAPFYTKLPTPKEQARVEPGLSKFRTSAKQWDDEIFGDIPEFLEGNKQAPTLTGRTRGPGTVYSGRALPKSGFAFLRLFESDGRRFGLSTDMAVMPLDRMELVRRSKFHGVALEGKGLPVAFSRAQVAALFTGDPQTGLKQERLLAYREAVLLSGQSKNIGGTRYLETRDGLWLRDEALTRIGPMRKAPGWATPGRTWLDISILKQTLVAYVGTQAVYATLVSTGADGLGDPKETHSTVRGQFLIHTKHVSVTMSGDEAGDEFDLRDVPYVQYFTEGYALHAAYWHDSFGKPRSHGCINLSPEDARWLFQWTDPPVAPKWHGAMSLRDGTLVHIHP